MIKLRLQFIPAARTLDPSPTAQALKAINQRFGKQFDGVVSAKITSSSEVKQLNQRYAGKNQTTDVLSFSYLEQSGPRHNQELGDIVVSRKHLQAQAKAAGTDVGSELALLITHGLLHIMGYDHQTPSQRRRLDSLQQAVMVEAGLVYRKFDWTDKK